MTGNTNTHITDLLKTFLRGLFIYLCAGFILSKVSKYLNSSGKEALASIFYENSAPLTFSLIANYATFMSCIFVLIGGLTERYPSRIRKVMVFYPAEFALNVAAVFVGLMTGYALGVTSTKLLILAFFVSLYSWISLIIIIWASYKGGLFGEHHYIARVFAVVIAVFIATYFLLNYVLEKGPYFLMQLPKPMRSILEVPKNNLKKN